MDGKTRSKLGKIYDRGEVEANQEAWMKELRKMYQKGGCSECGSRPANWATLKTSSFVCINCAQKLRADASNKVKNCLGTYLWHEDEMERMREGHRTSSASEDTGEGGTTTQSLWSWD